MLKTEEYRNKLEEVLKEIKDYFDLAEIGGNDISSFVFAKKENRAVEIYQSESAVIVEFWENEEEQSEIEIDSYEEARKLVVEWIKS